jgi:nucleotide-binding universal stress UspA family protein
MEMRKILWPTDLSGSAEKALPFVKSLIEKYNTEIHVLYVIQNLSNHKSWYGEFQQERIDKILKWEEKTAKNRLDELCASSLEGCPLYIKHVAIGDPAQEILKLIDKEKVDAVVLSTSGETGHYRLGSTAERVVRNAQVPVITIPVEQPAEV